MGDNKHIITLIPVLFISSVLIFTMVRLTAADPVTSLVGTKKLSDKSRAAQDLDGYIAAGYRTGTKLINDRLKVSPLKLFADGYLGS